MLRRKDAPILRDFAARWQANKLNLRPKTDTHYAYLLETHILPELGGLRLTDLTLKRLEDWQAARLKAGAGKHAVRQAADLLGTILRRAVAHRHLLYNPVEHLERPARHRSKIVPATPEQVELIRAYMLDRDCLGYASMISILAYVGAPFPGRACQRVAKPGWPAHLDRAEE